MLRIENSNYNKEGSEFFVAGAAAARRAMDGSMIGCQGLAWAGQASTGSGREACKLQARRPKQNVRHPRFEQQWDTFHAREMESRHNGG